jgi:hypothetical protein
MVENALLVFIIRAFPAKKRIKKKNGRRNHLSKNLILAIIRTLGESK